MTKVLVTGGAGFIGSHIVEDLLENNYEVAVIDNLSSGKLENIDLGRVKYYEGDIVNEEFVNKAIEEFGPQYIIHQAAQVSVVESVKNMVHDEQVNIKGSLNIINAARLYQVEKMVFASSAAVYGNPQYLPVDTAHNTAPMSPYGLSKLTVEKYLQIAKELYGLDYTILRYGNVYGPRQDAKGEGGVIAIFMDKVINDESVTIFGNGEQTRDFVYVKDVARANVLAMESKKGSKMLNIASGQAISILELCKVIQEVTNKELVIYHKDKRNGDIEHSALSNQETSEVLNWNPKVELYEGISSILKIDLQLIR